MKNYIYKYREAQYHNKVVVLGEANIHKYLLVSLLIFFGIFGLAGNSKAAYTPPIGIPAPSFGINEVAPDTATYCPNWPTSANGGTDNCYYIDSTYGNATDTGNTFGYPNKPRLTIPTTYTAGSYIEIHGGPYTVTTLALNVPGTVAKPIWFRGTPGNMPEFRGEIVPNGSYTIFEYLKFTTNPAAIGFRVRLGSVSHHMSVRNSLWTGPATSVNAGSNVSSKGDATHIMRDLVWYNNTMSGYGDFATNPTVEQDRSAFGPDVYSDNVWILNNTAYDMTGDGVIVGPGGSGGIFADNIFIGGNVFYHFGENAIDIKAGQNVVVSSNTFYNFIPTSHSSGEGVVLHSVGESGNKSIPNRIWVMNNKIHDANIGIISTGSDNSYFIGNEIYNIIEHAIDTRGSSLVYVINNTIDNAATGINIDSAQYIKNNIIRNSGTSGSDYDVWAANTTLAAASTIDNNVIYNTAGAVRLRWGNANVYDVAGFKTAFSKCLGCIESDPKFTNVGTRDYTLQSSSPAIDNGVVSAVYQTFLDLYGLSIAKDISGTTRPQGSAWDIGAYEYVSGVQPDTTPPSAPTGVTVN